MNPPSFFVNYAQALPGTPLYDYALATGMITDEEEYLSNVTDVDAADYVDAIKKGVLLNFSGLPLKEVLSWQAKVDLEVQMDYLRRQGGLKFYYKVLEIYVLRKILSAIRMYRKEGLRATMDVVMARLKALVAALSSNMKNTDKDEGLKGEQLTYLKQFGSGIMLREELRKLKLGKYDSRKVEVHNQNKHIQKYYDSYNEKTVVRFPSLREITQNMGIWEPHHLKKMKKRQSN